LKKVHADLDNLLSNLEKKYRINDFESMLEQIVEKIDLTLKGKALLARIMRPLDNNPIKFHKELINMEGI